MFKSANLLHKFGLGDSDMSSTVEWLHRWVPKFVSFTESYYKNMYMDCHDIYLVSPAFLNISFYAIKCHHYS